MEENGSIDRENVEMPNNSTIALEQEDKVSSVKGRKKQEKWRRIKESRVLKRRDKKALNKANLKSKAVVTLVNDETEKKASDGEGEQQHSKKFRKRLEKERLQAVMNRFKTCLDAKTGFDGLHVCIDLQFEELMSDKELSHLAGQLSRVYGANRTSSSPALISITSLKEGSRTMETCKKKSDGFANYIWHSTQEPVTSAFGDMTSSKVVYLTPDSPNVLQSLEPHTVYVMGGLVDDSIKKNSSQAFASAHDITTAKLPIDEYAIKSDSSSNSSFKKVLAINQVFDILMKFHQCNDWKEALKEGLPKRFGFEIQ